MNFSRKPLFYAGKFETMNFSRKPLFYVGKFSFLSGVKPFFVCLFVLEGGLLRSYFPIRHPVHLVGHRTATKRLLGWGLVFHYADMGKTTGHSGRNISK
jgi:hypothetical protein